VKRVEHNLCNQTGCTDDLAVNTNPMGGTDDHSCQVRRAPATCYCYLLLLLTPPATAVRLDGGHGGQHPELQRPRLRPHCRRGHPGRHQAREQQMGGSGGSVEPPAPLLDPPGPLLMHRHTVCIAYFECLPTRLNPLAERACFSQAPAASCRRAPSPSSAGSSSTTWTSGRAGLDEGLLSFCLPHSRLYG
jgi:hypothetical protein